MPTPSPFSTEKKRVGTLFLRFSSFLLGLFFLVVLSVLTTPHAAHANTDTDRELLDLYYEPQDLEVSSATRSPKPLSRSAESISVITAEQIEAMNAHNLADVLNTIPGVQVDPRGGPGSGSTLSMRGARTYHILVMIDGVPVNDLLASYPLIGQIPVQNIERIEIVKGPASSAWGSALGGVVSVITKEPAASSPPHGSASFSSGENGTRDTRGELTGTVGQLGYYLSGASLHSNGFTSNNATENNNLYAKLRWEIPDKGNIRLTLNNRKSTFGGGNWLLYDAADHYKTDYLQSTLSSDYSLTDRLNMSLLLKATKYDYTWRSSYLGIDPTYAKGDPAYKQTTDENTLGGALQLTWRQGLHTVTGGLEFDHGETETHYAYPLYPEYNSELFATNDKWGFFLNDTIAWERVTLTPAIRYDLTSRVGDYVSPSLGLTVNITSNTLFRAYVAQGYSLPALDPVFFARQNGRTVQAGLETTEIPYIWLKGTWFRNSTWDILTYDSDWNKVFQKELREGFEIEARTSPIFNTWLTAGYVFIDADNRTLDTEIKDEARYTWDLGLHYNDRTYRGALTGHYIRWNPNTANNARYKDFTWDLNMGWKAYKDRDIEAEIFFTGHNLFNGKQYLYDSTVNPSRWFEGGLRIKW